ncbi:uncharacterized protein LOC107629923 [Arachis ipaensis]|uniref:uncharacterized protein LOC107629923 n=1 Tax=Arachis ipaensis TaxID=130454 RepID=UPI000A2B27AC|nr:uncharacterized protein LOC107629923 [Arachis ipaensis]
MDDDLFLMVRSDVCSGGGGTTRCKIQATVRKTMIYRFKQLLSEGRVYVMKLFSVVPNQGSYRATRHQFKLIFQFRTTVRDAICDFIPKFALTISPFTVLLKTKEDSDFLVGRVGLQNVMFASNLGFNLDIPEVASFRKISIPHGVSASQPIGIAESGIYFCQFCNIHVTNVTPRFRVKVLVEDSTGVSIFVLFDREASYLLNKTCVQLFEQHLKDVDVVFGTQSLLIFQEIVGKTMLFKVLSRPVGMEKFKGTYPVRRVCDDAAILGMFKLSGSDLSPEKAGFVLKGEGSFGEPSKVTKSPNLGLTPSNCSELFAGLPQCTQKESNVVDLVTDEDAKCAIVSASNVASIEDPVSHISGSILPAVVWEKQFSQRIKVNIMSFSFGLISTIYDHL